MQGIYAIENLTTSKKYIGSTKNHKHRWLIHKRRLNHGKHLNPHLQHAWDKYGAGRFRFTFLEAVSDEYDLLSREQHYLDIGFEEDNLYNIARHADRPPIQKWFGKDNPMYGKHHTPETRAKMSESRSGENHPLYGTHHTEETKAKISKAHKGKVITEEHRAKLSEALKNSNHPLHGVTGKDHPMYGTHRSAETIAKMSGENHRLHGRRRSKETIAKMSKAAGRPYPPFHNVKTGKHIPAGHNLKKLCEQQGLSYAVFANLKQGRTQRTQDGWRVEEKI